MKKIRTPILNYNNGGSLSSVTKSVEKENGSVFYVVVTIATKGWVAFKKLFYPELHAKRQPERIGIRLYRRFFVDVVEREPPRWVKG